MKRHERSLTRPRTAAVAIGRPRSVTTWTDGWPASIRCGTRPGSPTRCTSASTSSRISGSVPWASSARSHRADVRGSSLPWPCGDGRTAPLSVASLRRIHATLTSALNTAVRRGLIERNPAVHRGAAADPAAPGGDLVRRRARPVPHRRRGRPLAPAVPAARPGRAAQGRGGRASLAGRGPQPGTAPRRAVGGQGRRTLGDRPAEVRLRRPHGRTGRRDLPQAALARSPSTARHPARRPGRSRSPSWSSPPRGANRSTPATSRGTSTA